MFAIANLLFRTFTSAPLILVSIQVIDIPLIKPIYIEHGIYRAGCSCGVQTTGTFLEGVDAPISDGNQITALIAYSHTRQCIPRARISEFLCFVYGMGISQGIVCSILERFALKALPAFELIKQAILDCYSKISGHARSTSRYPKPTGYPGSGW